MLRNLETTVATLEQQHADLERDANRLRVQKDLEKQLNELEARREWLRYEELKAKYEGGRNELVEAEERRKEALEREKKDKQPGK